MKRALIVMLERLCSAVDNLPWYEDGHRVCAGWGCRIGLARWSDALDQRWGAGVWK